MPSFDIVNKVDIQALDNAINTARKEITTRYDFHDSKSTIDFDKKELSVNIITENDMRIKAIQSVLISRMVKQRIDAKCLDFGKEQYASGNMVKKEIKIIQGIEKEAAKKIVKFIKDMNLKIQPSIMDDMVRVTGKKIDDLQAVIGNVKTQNFGVPVQFVNMK